MIPSAILDAAMSTPSGTPIHELAVGVCLLRGKDPNAYEPSHLLPPMMNWQRVVGEFMSFHLAMPR
jgi:hypothetical protein